MYHTPPTHYPNTQECQSLVASSEIMVVEYTDAGGASATSTLINVERSCVCNLNLSGIGNL